jgi:hypothetical protein
VMPLKKQAHPGGSTVGFMIQPEKHSSLPGLTKYWNLYKRCSKTPVAGH